MPLTDMRERLLAVFAAEREEHVCAMRDAVARARGGEATDVRELFRRVHSLKGAARAVEMREVEREAHALESLLEAVETGRRALDGGALDTVEAALDRLAGDAGEERAAGEPQHQAALVRVEAARVDAVSRGAGSLSLLMGGRAGDVRDVAAAAAALRAAAAQAVAAGVPALGETLAVQARALAFAARRMADTDDACQRTLDGLARETDALQLAPAAELVAGLDRMVRDDAASQGKSARLRVEGEGAEIDRGMLNALRDPLVHLLRNAVSHGVEASPRRAAAGKPAEATVTVSLAQVGGDLLLAVEDDGPGLDRRAVERATAAPAGLSEPALFARLFDQGISTAGRVDALAGRGVGLAVVAEAARRLGGSARIGRAPGGTGSRVEVRVPRAALRQPHLLLRAGAVFAALPVRAAGRVLTLAPAELRYDAGGTRAVLPGSAAPAPAAFLATLLDEGGEDAGAQAYAAVRLRGGEEAFVLLVDRIEATETLTVRPAAELAFAPPGVAGVAVTGDGTIALVLDPAALPALAAVRRGIAAPRPSPPRAEPGPPPTILVVDDSVTTRTLERSILEAAGHRVRLAVDGIDALDQLRARPGEVALMIADVEMPRLDGFGLLRAVRNDPALANIPVIMMTSRDAPDDVRRGLELGADAYVTKQEFDSGRLLDTVARFI